MELVCEVNSPLKVTELVECFVVCGKDFGCVWHRHRECEITLAVRGGAERLVGDKLESLVPGDLVFLGSELPHDYRANPRRRRKEGVKAIVVQFTPALFGSDWLERSSMSYMVRLFRRASRGLQVTGRTRDRAEELLRHMVDAHGARRLILLLELLELLAASEELLEIASEGFRLELTEQFSDRVGKALTHIAEHFAEHVSVQSCAHLIGLSNSAFSRLFKRCTGQTLPNYVNQFRIARACRLLAETDMTVMQIGYACGYASPAHFQRQFKKHAHYTPSDYRKRVCCAP